MEQNIKLKTALYLDDNRTPAKTIPGYEPWIVVRNYHEFVEYITLNGIPNLISFDHDLADEHTKDFHQSVMSEIKAIDYDNFEEMTGLDCAKWLCQYSDTMDEKINYCSVHSHNPVGALNIQSYINQFKRHKGWEQDCWIGKHETINND